MGAGPVLAPAHGRLILPIQQADVFALEHGSDVQISPNGRQLAYVRSVPDVRTDGPKRTIWLVDLHTLRQRPLISQPSSVPRWSPDGTKLAYLGIDATGHARLYVMDGLNASSPRLLDDGGSASEDFAWSPDGRKIAVLRSVPEPPAPLTIVSPAAPPDAHWAAPAQVITSPRYGQDGGGFGPEPHNTLFVVSADGGSALKINTEGLDLRGGPSWGPHSDRLVFAATPITENAALPIPALYEIALPGMSEARLTSGPDSYEDPAVSPDGRYLAFLRHENKRDIWTTQLWVMDRSTGRADTTATSH